MINLKFIVLSVISYIIGSISPAYLTCKSVEGIDIRDYGSGNAGTTNVLRTVGIKGAIITFMLDVFKGVLASSIGKWILGSNGQLIGGFFAVIGHNWPVFLKFKGGKGVATSLGVLATINLKTTIISVFIGLFIAFISNYVSLGSLSFLFSFPSLYYILGEKLKIFSYNFNVFILGVLYFILSINRHKSNILRLKNGTENKFR